MNVKSERLKKLESELKDLDQWLKLGLVPKKDIEKHKHEMQAIHGKIEEERERLRFIKESGEGDEYIAPKKNLQARSGFQEAHTIPDINIDETNMTDVSLELDDTETFTESETVSEDQFEETSAEDVTVAESEEDDEEDPFSDKNRWKRGVFEDPDSNNW